MDQNKIRNIAIIAHVDHGKTTLVDQILKQCGTFHEGEEVNERVMDSGAIERERGITILSKNASVNYKGYHINIVDTPGHADFGGQVERVLGTVDGVLLVVDAFEGPMAQTRFVTQKALQLGLTPIVVINKIDRDGCNPHSALDKVFDLFCELDANESQLDFSCVYASGRKGICRKEIDDPDGDLRILMDLVIDKIPAPKGDPNAAPLLQISTLEYSSFLGRMAVGRVQQGTFKTGMTVAQSFMTDNDSDTPKVKNIRIQKILHYDGIQSSPIDEAGPGEIIQIAGLETFDIGDTLSATDKPVSLPRIHIDPPTISMLFTVNTSPLAGKDGGKFLTGNNLAERLERAHMADPALLVEKADGASTFKVSGRGILHLTILVENMRRELYEFTIGSPQVIFQKDEAGKLLEPMETFKVEVPSEYSGPIIEELGRRKGEMVDMQTDENNRVNLEYKIPSRGLLGVRAKLLSLSKGYAISQSLFLGFEPYKGDIPARTNGVLIAKEPGAAASYALAKLEDRGALFIPPATEVYPGMIIGEHNRTTDIIVNATKGKHLTNMRSKASDDNIQLTPYRRMTLEECVTFINDDECVE
ncbi:translational GTPase TypA, partial [Hallerella succinigenes]